MIALTASMEFVTTETEAEALLLEANLIKKLKPRYNVTLRDDKSFPYILIAQATIRFAQIAKHRGARSHKGSYFGPFASAGAVNRTINALQKAFLLRSCSDSVFENRTRPVPALPDQALLGAVHRRDRAGRHMTSLVQRGGGVSRRQEPGGQGGARRSAWRRPPSGSISSRRRAIATASRP